MPCFENSFSNSAISLVSGFVVVFVGAVLPKVIASVRKHLFLHFVGNEREGFVADGIEFSFEKDGTVGGAACCLLCTGLYLEVTRAVIGVKLYYLFVCKFLIAMWTCWLFFSFISSIPVVVVGSLSASKVPG